MPKFNVELTRATYAYSTVEVDATSEEEAKHLVEKMLQDPKFDPEEDDVKFGTWEVENAEEADDTIEEDEDGKPLSL